MKGQMMKVYEVKVGNVNNQGDNHHVLDFTVLALDVLDVCEKMKGKLKKNEYVESCELMDRVDVV